MGRRERKILTFRSKEEEGGLREKVGGLLAWRRRERRKRKSRSLLI